jgi:transposase
MDAHKLTMIYEGFSERQEIQRARQHRKHQEFLNRLQDSCVEFRNELGKQIEERLTSAAYRGKRSVRFETLSFNRKMGNVKVSTLVYGWKNPQTTSYWDASVFQEIGFDSTPFDALVKEYLERGIHVKNVSDPSKGFGFWIEASF